MNSQQLDFKVKGPQIDQFNSIQTRKVPRASFKRDYVRKQTMDTDYLVPVFVDEILPGDDVHISASFLARLTTPIKPIMDNIYFETFWFFVPYRLVWDNWVKFQGQQTNPGDSIAYTLPKFTYATTNSVAVNTLQDYMGLPINVNWSTNDPNITCLYSRGYALIWDDWFRDENLLNSLVVPKTDLGEDLGYYTLQKRGKRKDYFTSALPFPQKGAAVTIPLGTNADVWGNSPVPTAQGVNNAAPYVTQWIQRSGTSGAFKTPLTTVWPTSSAAPAKYTTNWNTGMVGGAIQIDPSATGNNPGTGTVGGAALNDFGLGFMKKADVLALNPSALAPFTADLTTATAITINTLRLAALTQQILELDARGGTRYVEAIYARFGVVSPDFRLQRPELIGIGRTPVNVYAVPQTAPTVAAQTPQGNLAAFGVATDNGGHQAKYAATEHGMIIGIANIRADLTYQQGIPKMFTRVNRLDFYEPLLNGLGEQAILNKEIYTDGSANDALVFGYQERFAEYKFRNSEICGQFRSTAATPLDVWHLAQKFTALPVLGSSAFIEEAVPMNRVVAVTTEPKFYVDCHFRYNHVRPMPIRSTPGIDIL